MMRLCFGTFAQVLRLCKLDNVTDTQLVGTMTLTVDPECQYIESINATAVSRLLSCEGNLSNGRTKGGSGAIKKPGVSLSNVIQAAQKADKADVVRKFQDSVIGLIDEDKKEQAVHALLDIINKDTVLDNDKRLSFEKYMGITKKALLSQGEFVLAEFLAGLFLYTAAAGVVNTLGKESVKVLTADYLKQFDAKKGSIRISNLPQTEVQSANAAVNLSEDSARQAQILNLAVNKYFAEVWERYGKMKIFLLSEEFRDFYSLYVVNDIFRKMPSFGEWQSIGNVNAKSVSSISRFVILTGTAGLGKSMMMNHLLLSAIQSYGTLGLFPVFIQLKDFTDDAVNLFDFIYNEMHTYGSDVSNEQFDTMLNEGSCLLLFDGLDEVSLSQMERFERELRKFADTYSKNRFIISSRPYQNFLSFTRFSILRLQPFNLQQALALIDNLNYRPDVPKIAMNFRTELKRSLFKTHKEFAGNPLLLTIMLLTFGRNAEVPKKMHLFYEEIYNVLAKEHDANKGFLRRLKTGMSKEDFADCFAEICFRSYIDNKYEFTTTEFNEYFRHSIKSVKAVSVSDFLYDLCFSLCLMYLEGGKYRFVHRSFQEYFTAVFMSVQTDELISKFGDFFEKRSHWNFQTSAFTMLYDINQDRVEQFILIPYLSNLYADCDKKSGYWTFLETLYPVIRYEHGETSESPCNDPNSYLFDFITRIENIKYKYSTCELPFVEDLVVEEIKEDDMPPIVLMDGNGNLASEQVFEWPYYEVGEDEDLPEPEVIGWILEFDVADILRGNADYTDLLKMLENDEFIFKKEYIAARQLLNNLISKHQSRQNGLLSLL